MHSGHIRANFYMSQETSAIEFDRAHSLAMYESLINPEKRREAKAKADRAKRIADRRADTGL